MADFEVAICAGPLATHGLLCLGSNVRKGTHDFGWFLFVRVSKVSSVMAFCPGGENERGRRAGTCAAFGCLGVIAPLAPDGEEGVLG